MTADPVVEMSDVDIFVPAPANGGTARRTYLLRDVNWTVRAGEHWIVLGPNGAGKSTLCALAAARRHPSRGVVSVLGRRLGSVDLWTLHPRIGLVDWGFIPPGYLEARGVVASGLSGSLQPRPEDETDSAGRIAAALALVDGTALASRYYGTLSRGQQGRVLIARALVGRPELLVLDEPAAGLDLPGREDLLGVFGRLAARYPKLATVTVTHLLEEIPPTASHALLVANGRLAGAGPVEDVLASEVLSACYGRPLEVRRHDGRWSAVAGPSPAPPEPATSSPAYRGTIVFDR